MKILVTEHARTRAYERGFRGSLERFVRDGLEEKRFSKKAPAWAHREKRRKAYKGQRAKLRYVWDEERSWIAACKMDGRQKIVVVTFYPPRA